MEENKWELLFRNQRRVGKNLYEIMKEEGYTKISFSKATNISRPTLNLLFEGEVTSITTFEKHINKVIKVLEIQEEDLLKDWQVTQPAYQVVCSCNEPKDYQPTQDEKEMFDTLKELIELCDFYY